MAVVLFLLATSGCGAPLVQPKNSERIRVCLEALAAGREEWGGFSVSYDDLHGLHGGLSLIIHGDGRVEQQAVRRPVGTPRRVSRPDLDRLLTLLRELKAWEQRTPERQAVPDESTGRLTIWCGGVETTIWEWHNDMKANARIARVRTLMAEIAWTPTGE